MGLTRSEALTIMGLDEGCSNKDIRERFKKLALKWHPDKNILNPDEAQKKFQAMSAAYTKLISTEETEDEISTSTLREMFSEIWEAHNRDRSHLDGNPHLFCDCAACQMEWDDLTVEDFFVSDFDSDSDDYDGLYYGLDDKLYADGLLKDFADKLYRNFNTPRERPRKRSSRTNGSDYRKQMVSAEEATRNAEELLKAEEEERRQAEKKKQRNKKKKESKKRRKAKQKDEGDDDDDVSVEKEAAQEKTEPETEHKPFESAKMGGGAVIESVGIEHEKDNHVKTRVRQTSDRRDDRKKIVESKGQRKREGRLEEVSKGMNGILESVEEEEVEVEEEEEEPVVSEEELDFTSAFVKHATVSASRSKVKDSGVESVESHKKSKGHSKSLNTGEGYTSQPGSKYGDKYRTDFKGLGGSGGLGDPGEVGINGTAPIVSSTNGFYPTDEEDDLSPTDMREAAMFEPNLPQSRKLAGEGNRAAKTGEFERAVDKYSEAIKLYPFDHRYFGNRSFCYDYLHEYNKALSDGNSALKIDSGWAKGYYRRGRALTGLQRYEEAVKAFSKALQLDPLYTDAAEQLEAVQVEQLQSVKYSSKRKGPTVVASSKSQTATDTKQSSNGHKKYSPSSSSSSCSSSPPLQSAKEYTPVYNSSGFEIPPRMLSQAIPTKGCSIWVGNVNSKAITEQSLTKLFQRHGQVSSVRVLYERRCAFVNYTKPNSAAIALKRLQGYHLGGCFLLLRYPENTTKAQLMSAPVQKPRRPGAAGDDECYSWRTTGSCPFGPQCRYVHLPSSRASDAAGVGDR